MMKPLLAMVGRLGVLFVVAWGCCGKTPMDTNISTWRTDAKGLEKPLPFVGSIVRCAWTTGTAQDRSGGVPGPSSYFVRGYAILKPEEVQRLKEKYPWKNALGVEPTSLDAPPQDSTLKGTVLESPELVRALPTESTYHSGRIYLLPESSCIYFDLIKD